MHKAADIRSQRHWSQWTLWPLPLDKAYVYSKQLGCIETFVCLSTLKDYLLLTKDYKDSQPSHRKGNKWLWWGLKDIHDTIDSLHLKYRTENNFRWVYWRYEQIWKQVEHVARYTEETMDGNGGWTYKYSNRWLFERWGSWLFAWWIVGYEDERRNPSD